MTTFTDQARNVFGVNVFVNRDSGVLCRVRKVDDSYAYLEILAPGADGLQSAYSMPVAEYDATFANIWRPAQPGDLIGFEDDGYRPPANVPTDWGETS